MEIKSAKVVFSDDDNCLIQWDGGDGFFGELAIKHIHGTGNYLLDAEYMDIKSVIKIIQLLNTEKNGVSEK